MHAWLNLRSNQILLYKIWYQIILPAKLFDEWNIPINQSLFRVISYRVKPSAAYFSKKMENFWPGCIILFVFELSATDVVLVTCESFLGQGRIGFLASEWCPELCWLQMDLAWLICFSKRSRPIADSWKMIFLDLCLRYSCNSNGSTKPKACTINIFIPYLILYSHFHPSLIFAGKARSLHL